MAVILWEGIFICIICGVGLIWCQFFECHDDPAYIPDEGELNIMQFLWLGVLQYIHVKNATPHYFRVPRVVLISRQFVLSTAVDAAQVPDEYALGNVVFGDYERDEDECNVNVDNIASGADCAPAILLMPIADVLLHPEYKHFGAKNSIALLKMLKPIKSAYVLPACLPFKDFLVNKFGRQATDKLYHIDYINDVPRDFTDEEKQVTMLSLLPKELCYLYDDMPANTTNFVKHRMACSTGCGFHSGAASLVHEHTGHWNIVAMAIGDSPCLDPLRPRRPPAPARHILLYPYVPWITAAIAGKAVGAFSKDDPFGFAVPRATIYDLFGHRWMGHWWMGGLRCFDRGHEAEDMFVFYHEIFQAKPTQSISMNYMVEINAAHNTLIICVKVGMPYRLGKPKVWNLNTPVAKVLIPVLRFRHMYRFQIQAWAYNASIQDASSDTMSSSCQSSSEGCA